MGIIADLQGELVSSEKPIGPILLKIRLLAAKLGSRGLEEWIKHEAEGYPQGHEVPDYRRLGMSFSGTFSGPFGSGVSNAPIAPALVAHFAGEENAKLALRESAASVDAMREGRNGIQLDCSNLILKLQGKVYPQFACNSVVGYVSDSALVEVSNAIRNRLLELTIGLESEWPEAGNITLANVSRQPELANQIFNQTFYGSATNIHSSGANASIQTVVSAGSVSDLVAALRKAGLSSDEADDLADAIQSEPGNVDNSGLGSRARAWLADRITKGVDTGVKGGISTVIKVAEEAAMQFFGLR